MRPLLSSIILLHLAVPAGLLWNINDITILSSILPCIALSIFAFLIAYQLIPSVAIMTADAGMSGRDLNKNDGGIMYVASLYILLLFIYYEYINFIKLNFSSLFKILLSPLLTLVKDQKVLE